MTKTTEKRTRFRRYEDRRVALMLSIHEILFGESDRQRRDALVIEAARGNFGADFCALLQLRNSGEGPVCFDNEVGNWPLSSVEKPLQGVGFETLLNLHDEAPGAICLMRVKRPPVFQADSWENLWEVLEKPVMALLSVKVEPKQAPPRFLWLLQTGYSREWSSRDRDLIEEVASLLARVRDKDLKVK